MITSIRDVNPNYLIKLFGTDEAGKSVDIVAAIPEEFSMGSHSSWEALMPNFSLASLVSNSHGDSAGGLLQKTTGISLSNSKLAQTRVWAGTAPLQFSIPIILFALTDASKDVVKPLKDLMSLTMPSMVFSSDAGVGKVGNQLMVRAPGPTVSIAGRSVSKYNMSLYIGMSYHFTNVIVETSDVRHRSMFTQYGEFITASCDLSVTTSTIVTKEDLDGIFINDYSEL